MSTFDDFMIDEAVAKNQELQQLRDTKRDLLEVLTDIASFAVGNGDVCEIIARRARKAIAKAEDQ